MASHAETPLEIESKLRSSLSHKMFTIVLISSCESTKGLFFTGLHDF